MRTVFRNFYRIPSESRQRIGRGRIFVNYGASAEAFGIAASAQGAFELLTESAMPLKCCEEGEARYGVLDEDFWILGHLRQEMETRI